MIDYASLSEKEIARRIRSYEEKYGMPYARDNRQFDCDSVLSWEAGDLILLPIMPEGCEHQHFNRHADKPCKWMAFIYKPMHDEVASYIEQKEVMPTGQ